MKDQSIMFNVVDEENAKKILREKNYYFKIGAFRKNFKKTNEKYSIEFAYLADIASLDMQLRYMLLEMSLDLEHSLKCRILNDLTENTEEDGYRIMEEYFSAHPDCKNKIFNSVIYSKDVNGNPTVFEQGFEKYYNDPPVWVCLELMDFGQLAKFISFYSSYRGRENVSFLEKAEKQVYKAKKVRNICAHNKPLILHLTPNEKVNIPPDIKGVGRGYYQLSIRQMLNKTALHTLCLFNLHRTYCNSNIKNRRKLALQNWLERYERNKKYYKNSNDIILYHNTLKKLIDKHHSN